MMQLVWEKEAFSLWEDTARYIERQFGYLSMVKYINDTIAVEQELMANPNAGIEERLLTGGSVLFRSIRLAKHNKLIYYITDKINIIDIWDTRREPKKQASGVSKK